MNRATKNYFTILSVTRLSPSAPQRFNRQIEQHDMICRIISASSLGGNVSPH